jgi:PAS domain S-box-containing protein
MFEEDETNLNNPLVIGHSVPLNSRHNAGELSLQGTSLSRDILENLPTPIYLCDAFGYLTYYNKAAARLWGREPELGKDLWCGSWKIYKEDGVTLPLHKCPMAVALKERRPVYGEEIIIEQPDGTRRNILPHPRPLFDASGALAGAVNMLIDITDIAPSPRTIRKSEEQFQSFADHAPIIIWMADKNGKCTYVNKKWYELTGKNMEGGVRDCWDEHVHSDERGHVKRTWNEAVAQRAPYDIKFRFLTSGDIIIARATGTPHYNDSGEFVGYIGIIQDITLQEMAKSSLEKEIQQRTADLLRRNEELRRSEERYYRMIAEVKDYAIILLSPEGIIENWNSGAEEIKGYKASEIIGKHLRIFYVPEDQEEKLPERLLQIAVKEGRATHEGWRIRKDGTRFWGSTVITALHDEENNIVGFSKVTRDLSEKRNAEEAMKANARMLEQKNKELSSMNQELASFAYVSSHDLQEPLRKIQTFATRIVETEQDNLSQKGKDYFSRMQNAALRMQTLIEDLLAYSRTNTADKKFEMTDLNQILENSKNDLKELIDEKHAVIDSSTLPELNVIAFQFGQLFNNILSNALKFSKPDVRPHITIRTTIVSGKSVKEYFLPPDLSFHHISFKDNGIGFETEHKEKIFEVFQRLHGRSEYSGTGIGLAICKKIVENHGGYIFADSKPDEGATFHVFIPVS